MTLRIILRFHIRPPCWVCEGRREAFDFDTWRGYVYECFDADGAALYIGRTGNFGKRMRDHRRRPWSPAVTSIRVNMTRCWDEMYALELRLIKSVKPLHNMQPVDIALKGHATRRARAALRGES